MPRKISKTDHVLDLISGKEEETAPKKSAKKSVKVVENENNDELSNAIKEQLAKEVSEDKPKAKPSKKESKSDLASDKKFVYINVMESIVENNIENRMTSFDMCTCEHCRADVMALTLTKLPAKYVVTDAQVSPLLNYYSSKYYEIINIELTKACTLISKFPHHD